MTSLQAGSSQILKTIVDAKGDIIAATADNAVDNLTVGANNTVLMAASGETTGLKWSDSPIAVDTVWDAKGDLVVGTAANTAARLAAGTNDYVLTAASGETTGLKWAAAAGGGDFAVCDGRLTLTTAVPVTTADVTAAATLYFTPYKGSKVGLYNGSTAWTVYDFTELSLSLVGYTASKPYDIWVYDNSGTPTLDSTIWTDGTTRATALTTQDGIYVKTGATTRRYLGTIYINSSGAQTDDSLTKRCVWNYYNRVPRMMYRTDSNSHSYSTTTYRAWNNDANQKFEVVVGVSEHPAMVGFTSATLQGAAARGAITGVGYDATNAVINDGFRIENTAPAPSGWYGCKHEHLTGIGYHYYSFVEYPEGGACTFGVLYGFGSILG